MKINISDEAIKEFNKQQKEYGDFQIKKPSQLEEMVEEYLHDYNS